MLPLRTFSSRRQSWGRSACLLKGSLYPHPDSRLFGPTQESSTRKHFPHGNEVPTGGILWSGALSSPPLDAPGLAQRDTSPHALASIHLPVLTAVANQHPRKPQGHLYLSSCSSLFPSILHYCSSFRGTSVCLLKSLLISRVGTTHLKTVCLSRVQQLVQLARGFVLHSRLGSPWRLRKRLVGKTHFSLK